MIVVAGAVEEAFKVSQGQASTAFRGAEFVDIPVPQGRGGLGGGGLQSFSQEQGQQRFMEQITLIFQFLTVVLEGEVFKASSQDRVQLLLHLTLVLRKKLGVGFFALFSGGKKVPGWVRTRGQNWVREAVEEAEAEVVVEEGAETRIAAGFRPLRVCTQFLEHQLGRPVWVCAYGDRCTFAHSWAELHPEASAHEQQLASHFPD